MKVILGCILFMSINTSGQFKTEKNYDYVTGPINGLAEGVLGDYLNGKRCLLDSTGKELTQCVYERIGFGTLDFSNGFAVVIRNGKYGFLSRTGVEIIKCKYECALNFSEGIAAVKENGKWGFINQKGDYAIANIYDSETAGFFHEGDILFSNGYARVILNGKAIFINKKGNKIKDCPYERVEPFHSGLAAVKLKDKWGFIDTTLSQTIPCIYDGTPMFPNMGPEDGIQDHYPNVAPIFNSNGLCVVAGEYRAYYTIIDKTGKQLIPWSSELSDAYDAIEKYRNQ